MNGAPVPVALDARMLNGAVSGVATYAASLRQALTMAGLGPLLLTDQAGQRESRIRRWVSAARPGSRPVTVSPQNAALVGGVGLFREAQVHFDLYRRPLVLRTDHRPGLIHWTYPVPLLLEGWTNLYTVHDAIPLVAPDLTAIDPVRHRRLLDTLRRAGGSFITVSGAARHEISTALEMDAAEIGLCWQGVDLTTGPLPEGTARDYFLVCGTVERRKNVAAIIDAHRLSGTTLPLLLVGPQDGRDRTIDAALAANSRATCVGTVPRLRLEKLIAGARALLFVSLAEGFGLPIVEAQMLGTPVLTSAFGAQAEIAGDAALKADPNDVAAMADAIARLADDEGLCVHLRKAGLDRGGQFTIAAFGERLVQLYRTFGSGGI